MEPRCATYTLLTPEYFQNLGNSKFKHKYICYVKIASRESDYGEYEYQDTVLEI